MNGRVQQLAARRRNLQARCAAQRSEILGLHAEIDAGAARIDRGVALVRRLGPLFVAVGVVAAVAVGPARLLGVLRQALPFAMLANRASRLMR